MRNLLGGKGANLAEMVNIGLPVPAGFTITTEVCTAYYKNNKNYPKELKKQVDDALKRTEKEMGAKFGDKNNPLLVSVSFRCKKLNARHDGNCFKRGTE